MVINLILLVYVAFGTKSDPVPFVPVPIQLGM